MADLYKYAIDRIIASERQGAGLHQGMQPRHPLLVIYLTESFSDIFSFIQQRIETEWDMYSNKVVQLCYSAGNFMACANGSDNNPPVNISDAVDCLTVLDSNLAADFRYDKIDVFFIMVTSDFASSGAYFDSISSVVGLLYNGINGREINLSLFSMTYFDVQKAAVNQQIEQEYESGNYDRFAGRDVVSFFAENKLTNGARLQRNDGGWTDLYKILWCIIRLVQDPTVTLNNRLHAVSFNAIAKPYREMAVGVLAAAREHLAAVYYAEPFNINGHADIDNRIKERMGFSNGSFSFISRYLEGRLSVDNILDFFPRRVPHDFELQQTADQFNRETLGAFFAYVDRQVCNIDEDTRREMRETFINNITANNTFNEIRTIFSDEGLIARIITSIKEILDTPVDSGLGPEKFFHDKMIREYENFFADNLLPDCIKEINRRADAYYTELGKICGMNFPDGDNNIVDYYKGKVNSDPNIHDFDENIKKICDPVQKIEVLLQTIIIKGSCFSASLETEIRERSHINEVQVAAAMLEPIRRIVKYFSYPETTFRENLDFAGACLYINTESSFCNEIRNCVEDHDGIIYLNSDSTSDLEVLRLYCLVKVEGEYNNGG